MPKLDRSALPSTPFWGLLVAFALLFLTGGSARGDVQSLAILNPALITCCGVALLTLRREHCVERKRLAYFVGFIFFLGLLYIVPQPVHLEAYSRGLSNIADIRAATDVSGSAQTLAMAPQAALQPGFFLFAPLAVILFAVQLGRDELRLALLPMIILGCVSGIVGVLQLAGDARGPLYFYNMTNNGSAVGLFANRNHAAVFLACLFPMLAIFAGPSHGKSGDGRNTRQLVATAVAIILIPLILVTGSRSGMLTAIIGLMGGVLLYVSTGQAHRGSKARMPHIPVLAVTVVTCLVFATIYFSRAEAIERIFVENKTVDVRADFWTSGMPLFWQYFPFGFGPGAFVPAFQVDEPIALLDGSYLNRLHNDWLETGVTYGVPGILLMLAGAFYYFWRTFHLWVRCDGARRSVALGRMASVIIVILAIASLSDYPLRTPAMMGFAALVWFWFAGTVPERSAGSGSAE